MVKEIYFSKGACVVTSHRIASLKADIEQALRTVSYGTPNVVARRRYLCEAFVYELIELHAVVPRLRSLNEKVWHKIVALWRKKGNQPKTIINKLSTFRQLIERYVGLGYFPDNAVLGLEKVEKTPMPFAQPDVVMLESITNTIVYPLCALQRYFGLKKQEAIRAESFMLTAEALFLSRSAAYNSKNRVIPIEEPAQKALFAKFQNEGFTRFITPVYDTARLSILHRIELSKAGIVHDDYFRHQYAVNRYQALCQNQDKTMAFRQLRHEMGYQRNDALKELLVCHDDC